jgi:uncharacterized LabA/DUF88 family protein
MTAAGAQRVSLFVDVQNIYYTCREAYQAHFDYPRFWARATADRELGVALAYETDRGDPQQARFQDILRGIGFSVQLKPMLRRRDGSAKADWDVGIALDVYEAAQRGEAIVLASGDGDFTMLVERIRARFDTWVEIYGVPSLTADPLIRAANRFTAIDGELLLR